ncbi:hypothetical protein CSB37_00820 [bacterium DOLZORAL124_38_8]|nr:MAG: hypothetical protein CSB37_00820 [bacterium DOLZORAL124_38_8]
MKNQTFCPPNTDGIIISDPLNIFYLTGFMGSFGIVLLKKSGQKILVTDGRYKLTAQELSAKKQFHFVLFDEHFNTRFAPTLRGTWGIEDTITLRTQTQYQQWFCNADLVVQKNFIEQQRRTKTTFEIESTQAAATHTDECIKKLLPCLKVGVTEAEISNILRNLLEQTGEKESFENIIAFGENSAKPHHEPGLKKLARNMPVLIDCGSRVNGYCSDMTRNFWFGDTISSEYENAYQTLFRIQSTANEKFVSQTPVKGIALFVRAELGAKNEFFIHSLGHGTGLNVHEAPSISKKSTEVLQTNDIVTNEPGLYFDGKFGIRIEDQLVVKEAFNENNVLTRFSKELIKI